MAALDKVRKGFRLDPDGFTVSMAAAIPRSAVPGLPPLLKGVLTGGDFSCNVLGFQKGWWVNYDLDASMITWDEPSEASLYPSSWGNFSFA